MSASALRDAVCLAITSATASDMPGRYFPETIQRTELASVLKCTFLRSQKWSTIHAIVDARCRSASSRGVFARLPR